ncbi:hypothetical protein QE152_g40497 [Popillia japonica]|uniref:Uncharacterized protein n=1 Tax=Popillia japonica TaxID=7064 RepID=A0AAW1HG30_POPJA
MLSRVAQVRSLITRAFTVMKLLARTYHQLPRSERPSFLHNLGKVRKLIVKLEEHPSETIDLKDPATWKHPIDPIDRFALKP